MKLEELKRALANQQGQYFDQPVEAIPGLDAAPKFAPDTGFRAEGKRALASGAMDTLMGIPEIIQALGRNAYTGMSSIHGENPTAGEGAEAALAKRDLVPLTTGGNIARFGVGMGLPMAGNMYGRAVRGAISAAERNALPAAERGMIYLGEGKGKASIDVPDEAPRLIKPERPMLIGADHPSQVSVARPTVPGRALYGDPDKEMLMQDVARMLTMEPEALRTSTRQIKGLPFMKSSTAKGASGILNDAVQRGADNLEYIATELTSPADFNMSRKWYGTANKMSGAGAENAGVSEDVAHAITANYSPGTDWNVNIARQERLLKMLGNNFDLSEPSAMKAAEDHAMGLMNSKTSQLAGRYSKKEIKEILRTPFLALDDEGKQLVKVMATDAAQNPKRVASYAPDGSVLDPDYTSITWGSGADLKKIVNILKDPNLQTISENLGKGAKVPTFYNDIASPNSLLPMAVNDTHNMAGVNFFPYAQKDMAVARGFGAAPTGGGATQGVAGHYGLYNDAVVEVGKRLGIPPMQAQSIVWETTRKLFDDIKTPKLRQAVADAWKNNPNANNARREITEIVLKARQASDYAKGIKSEKLATKSSRSLIKNDAPFETMLGDEGAASAVRSRLRTGD